MNLKKPGIAIHGGAGTISQASLSEEQYKNYIQSLNACIEVGYRIIEGGGTSLDAVTESVKALEDNPLFNAGKGAVFTHNETHELDASIMSGFDLDAGAVTCVSHIKNPVLLARKIMEQSEFVMLSGRGAEVFAKLNNIETADDAYFYSDFRFQQLQQLKNSDKTSLDHNINLKKGTVGAVALDIHGNLAAATSTGGMTNKRYNRIGDTPIIGSGTYANNQTCAISCTGHGEYFIRSVVAHDISCLMEYSGLSLNEACHEVVMKKLVNIGGEGGLVAIDKFGNIALVFNSEGMYRASHNIGEERFIAIYK